jgi:hypothetical protein
MSVLALLACAAIVATASFQAVRDVAIALVAGFAIRTWVRWAAARRRIS